jgi:hypothetical protein
MTTAVDGGSIPPISTIRSLSRVAEIRGIPLFATSACSLALLQWLAPIASTT